MNEFSIKNLEQYQHYTDRKPIWIKLYCSIISDPQFAQLSDHGKATYLLLLPLASQHNNKLPEDVQLITKLLHLDKEVDLQELRNKGFVVDYQIDTKVIPQSHGVPQESLSIYLGVSNGVIGYLNNKTGKKYRETESNRKEIRARLHEGYTQQDCETVIDNRVAHWMGTEQEQYLRPSTLFRKSKFDGYVNAPMPDSITGKSSDKFKQGRNDLSKQAVNSFLDELGEGRNVIALNRGTGA